MTPTFLATRQIGIDMGHRVTNHKSKCRNLHGHRYTIEAAIAGQLQPGGSSQGMVEDFGDLKAEMTRLIDEPCDHGLCLWVDDPLIRAWCDAWQLVETFNDAKMDQPALRNMVERDGYAGAVVEHIGKVYVLPVVPTAENLARHWYQRLTEEAELGAALVYVKVWETPNCWAQYPTPIIRED